MRSTTPTTARPGALPVPALFSQANGHQPDPSAPGPVTGPKPSPITFSDVVPGMPRA